MRSRLAVVPVLVLAAASQAAPRADVDRERLKKAAMLPTSRIGGWYYGVQADGRTYEGGQEPEHLDVTALRARLQSNDSDLPRWQDLAAAYGISGDTSREAEARGHVVAIVQRRAAERPQDGEALASLGLAFLAAGDDAGADDSIRSAERAATNSWAGTAAFADLLVLRATAKAAATRFATLDDAMRWLREKSAARALRVDRARLAAAMQRYDEAIAGLEKAGASGTAAASVYIRRSLVGAVCRTADDGGKPRASAPDDDPFASDQRKAMDLLPSDPYAVTRSALAEAVSTSADSQGARHVESWQLLSKEAQAAVTRRIARLEELAGSADAETAARAWQGIACVQWFSHRDPAATEASLRKSVAKDPRVAQSWNALFTVVARGGRMEDLEKVCRDRVQALDTAEARLMLVQALTMRERWADAEKECRLALALDPAGYQTNLGVAVLLLRNADEDAILGEVPPLLEAAEGACKATPKRFPWGWYELLVAKAVWQGLKGDLNGAEASARQMLRASATFQPAKEILAAIGR